jgi:hypothetical protein
MGLILKCIWQMEKTKHLRSSAHSMHGLVYNSLLRHKKMPVASIEIKRHSCHDEGTINITVKNTKCA